MSQNLTRSPESVSEPLNDIEELDSRINGLRQLITALQRELKQLEQRRRSLKRQRALQASVAPSSAINRRQRKSNVTKILLIALAVLLAGLGQLALHTPFQIGGWRVNGWILYGSAAVLFLFAVRKITVGQFAQGELVDEPSESFSATRAFWPLLILASLSMLGSVILFGKPTTLVYGWIMHIASVLLFIAAFIPFDELRYATFPPRTQLITQFIRALPIMFVLAIAIFVRLWQLREFPFGSWFDEAASALAAAQILHDPSFRPVFFDYTELPAHFNYLIALSFSVFGESPFALRLITAGFGISAVVFAYLLFRRWFGEGLGLIAAFILAIMRYHLTFSRFGMHGIATPAFVMAALYFLDRALADKKVADFAWFGLTVGFGLAFYHAFRLFFVVLAVFLISLLISAFVKYGIRETMIRYVRGLSIHWIIAGLALLIALAPVAQFAVRNNEAFTRRMGMTSIFSNREEPDLAKAYRNNLSKHLLMFNVRGDRNGRHNLPGAPMLDPVMGVLFILGGAYALWNWRNPSSLLMLLTFIIMLHGGILTLDFEAPQSLRSIGVIPALIYFITLPLAAITHIVKSVSEKNVSNEETKLVSLFGHPVWNSGLLVLLIIMGYLNLDMFFDKQKNDPSVWAQHSAGETIVANEMNRLTASHDLIVSGAYDQYPTVRFLAGDVKNVQRWTVIDRLPIVHDDNGRGAAIMLDPTLLSTYNDARRLYPDAEFIEHHAPTGGGTVMYEVILTPDDLRAVHGVVARYFSGSIRKDEPLKEEILPEVAVDWMKSSPSLGSFIADLRSTLYIVEYGQYRFNLSDMPGSTLWIDEFPVGDAPLTLARGNHALRLEVPGGRDKMELWWQPPGQTAAEPIPRVYLFRPPVTNSGLLGTYYASPDWSGTPAFEQIDPQIAFYFHIIPLPRPYTVEWTGKIFAPFDGSYRFAIKSVDGSQLKLNGNVVVDNPNGHTTAENNVELAQGWHDILIRFSDTTSATQIYLYWVPPGADQLELLPNENLLPPMGSYPATPEALVAPQ